MAVGSEFRSPRDLVADEPQLRKEPDVDPLAENLDRGAFRADHVAADDALDRLQMLESPDDGPFVPRHHLLGELIKILELVSALVPVNDLESPPLQQPLESLAEER